MVQARTARGNVPCRESSVSTISGKQRTFHPLLYIDLRSYSSEQDYRSTVGQYLDVILRLNTTYLRCYQNPYTVYFKYACTEQVGKAFASCVCRQFLKRGSQPRCTYCTDTFDRARPLCSKLTPKPHPNIIYEYACQEVYTVVKCTIIPALQKGHNIPEKRVLLQQQKLLHCCHEGRFVV